ncbi:MAG: RluA family pseudouridine synthase [Candidatus Omnitrophica bacterium]|nr:RluA family pseudouridine synthase [Candidatus Omnitrophota bacterium]
MKPNIPRKHQPKGFEILYEDRDVIVGNKAAGYLTVSALWNKVNTIHSALNWYVRKGQVKSRKCVYVVHRLDQATTGVLVFAKSVQAQVYLKDHWKTTEKIYYAIVQGHLNQKSGTVSSYLQEDEDYIVHSSADGQGKLAHTEYTVLKENSKHSLLKINLLTGRKNQIRVHMADLGHPVVGDEKYGKKRLGHLMLHARSIEFNHPFDYRRITVVAPVPEYFSQLVSYSYSNAGENSPMAAETENNPRIFEKK